MEIKDIPTRTTDAIQHALRILQDQEGYANSRIDPERYNFKQEKDSVSFTQFWVRNASARDRYETQIETLLKQLKSHGFNASSGRLVRPNTDKYDIIVMVHDLDRAETLDALEKLEAVNAHFQHELDGKQRIKNADKIQQVITAAIGNLPKDLPPDQAKQAVNELIALAQRQAKEWNVPCPKEIGEIDHQGMAADNKNQVIIES